MTSTTEPLKVRRQKHGIEAVTTSITLARRDHDRIRALATQRQTTMSAVIAQAVRVYLALVERDGEHVA